MSYENFEEYVTINSDNNHHCVNGGAYIPEEHNANVYFHTSTNLPYSLQGAAANLQYSQLLSGSLNTEGFYTGDVDQGMDTYDQLFRTDSYSSISDYSTMTTSYSSTGLYDESFIAGAQIENNFFQTASLPLARSSSNLNHARMVVDTAPLHNSLNLNRLSPPNTVNTTNTTNTTVVVQRRNSSKNKFACTECKKTFSKKGNLTSHLKTHNENRVKEHACSLCPKNYHYLKDLNRHTQLKHPNNPWYSFF